MTALEEHLLPADIAARIGRDPATQLGGAGALDDLGEGSAERVLRL